MFRRGMLVLGGVAAAVAAAVVVVLLVRSTSPTGVAVDARRLAMEMLGKRIAELRPGCKVLVLSNPFTRDAGLLDEKARFERAGIGGLRDGLGRRSPVKPVYPEIQPEYFSNPGSVMIPPDSPTPLSFLIVPASVDELAEANPGHDVIVSLIGLPAGVERLRIWGEKDPHCFALLLPDLRVLGPPEKAVEAFDRGKLLAAVVMDSVSGQPLIVTRENVREVLENQPRVLGY